MTSVTSSPALRRLCLLGAMSLFIIVVLATGVCETTSAQARTAAADRDGERPVADGQWVSAALAAEHSGEAPPCRMPAGRPSLTFGDSAWDEVTADHGAAAIGAAGHRERATRALKLAPLWASLQLQKIRLQN